MRNTYKVLVRKPEENILLGTRIVLEWILKIGLSGVRIST
jgi:hypothetical protein